MKLAKGITLLSMALIVAGATGCKKRIQDVTPLPGYEATQAGRTPLGDGGTFGPGGTGSGDGNILPMNFAPRDDWERDRATFAAQTVFFDFDQASVKGSEAPKLEVVASRFASMPGMALLIEGHCDERGTAEYNRSLGERRALAVRTFLVSLGVSADLIETVSFGEDRPADPGHNSAAWAKNRRGEVVLLIPPGGARP